MSAKAGEEQRDPRAEALRQRLLYGAVLLMALGLLHHADHAIRGEIVVDNGLDPDWNHSGWPFQDRVTPFTASLAIYVPIVVGIALTLRRRAMATYWLWTAVVLGAILALVHFLPGNPRTEWPSVIYDTYGAALPGALALLVLFALLVALVVQIGQAIRLRRASRS